MNETMIREQVHQAVDSHCAHLKEDVWLAQRILKTAKEPEVRQGRKLPLAVVVALVLVLLTATATATTLVWKQYVETLAHQEAEMGEYDEWPEQDRIALVQSLIDMGYLDDAAEKVQEFSCAMNDEERLAFADELVLTLIGQDDIRAVDMYSLTYAILGYEDFWTPEERIWWQEVQNIVSPGHENYTIILPDNSVISEQQAKMIAKEAILQAYKLPEDALEQAWPVADLYITAERPEYKRWYVRYILYRNNDYNEHFAEKRYTVVVDGDGNVVADEDRHIQSVYDLGAYAVAMQEGASEIGVIPSVALMREYLDRIEGSKPFIAWPYEEKAAYSAELHELLESLKGTDLYDMSVEAERRTLWFRYGVPGENDLTEQQALELARDTIISQLNVSVETVAAYQTIYSAFDITDPDHRMWKFIFINEDDWYGIRYRVQIDGATGAVLLIEALPWDVMLQDDDYDKKYY